MKIVISGYGRMGHEIESIAMQRGHEIVATIDTFKDWNNLPDCDVIIDFTTAKAAPEIAKIAFSKGIAFVSGTTGWNDKLNEIKQLAETEGKTFFYASNFSIGANIFFNINKKLASFLGKNENYKAEVHEVHHIHKKDAPSGTAITLAEDIISDSNLYTHWTSKADENGLLITSERIGEVPGIHIVEWKSSNDSIQIKHEAFNRKGLALGAVIAAEWVIGKSGVYGMSDLLSTD